MLNLIGLVVLIATTALLILMSWNHPAALHQLARLSALTSRPLQLVTREICQKAVAFCHSGMRKFYLVGRARRRPLQKRRNRALQEQMIKNQGRGAP